MPLISQQLPSYKGGVSQQPDILRYPDQAEEIINGYPSEVEGLQKRPPTEYVSNLTPGLSSDDPFLHIINRDENEKYICSIERDSYIQVWGLDGSIKSVNFANDSAREYIRSSNPTKDLVAVTVADYTFIVNRTKTVRMTNELTEDGYSNRTLLYIKNAQYAKVYSIWLNNDFKFGVLTPDGGEAKQAIQTSTTYIAQGLYNLARQGGSTSDNHTFDSLVNQVDGASNMIYAENGDIYANVWLYGDSTLMFEGHGWDIRDSFGGQNAYAIKNFVNSVTKLPPAAPNGYKVHVKSNSSSSDDDFWLEWDNSKASWVESRENGIPYRLDSSTMPHALVRNADGSFTLKALEWTERKIGDEDSNPLPSFVDKKINDIFFYRNRLGFVAEENVILSASADFFNFWFNSAIAVEDTDPIDIAISDNKVAIIDSAIPFARELMLFSKEGQFVLSSDGVLTPKSAKLDKITAFNYSDTCRPVGVGQSIFFINDRVDYCSLMRFYTVQDVADLKDAEDVSAHVPTYIPIGVSRLSGNTKDDIILLTSRTEPNTVWLYKYILQNGQSLQEAWCKWQFGNKDTKILLAECVDSYIYFVVETPYGTWLERAQIRGTAKDFDDEPYRLYMDRKRELVIPNYEYDLEYNEYLDTTTVNFTTVYGTSLTPLEQETATYYAVSEDGYYITNTGPRFVFDGDVRGKKFFFGRQYPFSLTLSKQLIRTTDSQGVTAEDEGKLQLRYYWVNYADSGVFKCKVHNKITNKDYEYLSTNRYLGRADAKLGTNQLFTDKFKFPVQGNSEEVQISISSDNPQPLVLISGGYEGFYFRRNKKM